MPTYHGDGRSDWTFAVELVFKDSQTQVTPWAEEDATVEALSRPVAFKAEEQERFDLLTAHWDVPLNELSMEEK